MADSILFNLAGTLITKLGSHVHQELGLLLGVNGELDKLKDTVSAIEAVLLDAQEQHPKSRALKDWLSKLKDVFYDIDDLIDEFNYEALRRQVMTINRTKTKQVRIFFSKSNQIAFSHKMGVKIKEIRERLKVVNDDRTQFHLSKRVINKPSVDVSRNLRDTGDYIPEEEVIGRNDEKKEIIDLLLNSNTIEDIAVVAIVGMGGLGKTVIAQSVYNDNMMTKHFALKLWVCVSEEFEVKVIIQNIIEYATKKRPESFIQMAPLQTELRKLVDGKKYLLVMDDVWDEDHEKWNTLKRSLIGGAKGSKILITTRSEQVAKTFDTTSLYPLGKLDDKNSWLLFEKMALGTELRAEKDLENSNLVEIGKEIVTKLKGIPLAIRTIGRLLYDKKSNDFWSSFKDKELYQIREQGGLKYMLSILKLSFNHLPLKQCFLYCALFPKDFCIYKDELKLQWRAHGFLKPNNEKDKLIDIGEDYFMELLSRSFFQDITKDRFGDITVCKMHDLMHDLACSIVKNECVYGDVNDINKRTHHFSFDVRSMEKFEALSKARNLRTFFVKHDAFSSDGIPEKIFYNHLRLRALELTGFGNLSEKVIESISKLKHLRYLSICNNIKCLSCSITELSNLETLILKCSKTLKELPRDLKKLINLRHLDLSRTSVEFIPDSITHLNNLESLILQSCYELKELPRDTKNLINLIHLDMHGCWNLTHVPKGVGELSNLQTLNLFVLGKDNNGGGLSELNGLNKLRGCLSIKGLQFFTTWDLQTNVKLLQLKLGLRKLKLEWKWDSNSFNESTMGALDNEYERVLECLHPHSNLQELYIDGYGGVRLCNWLSSSSCSFGCLVCMDLSSCERLQHLPQFSQFPGLKDLRLENLPNIEHIGNNDYPSSSTFFPSLKELVIIDLPRLKRWWKKGTKSAQNCVLFPCLSELCIWNCPLLASLKSLEINDELDVEVSWKSFPRLSFLGLAHIYEWEFLSNGLQHVTTLQEFSITDCSSLPESIFNLTSLSMLEIAMCKGLTSLPESIGNLASLSTLHILECEDLMSLPESIRNLTSLTELRIRNCPKLSSLPEGIRHLHCLDSLKIWKCPILKERCKEATGEDWHKIAHIRDINIF